MKKIFNRVLIVMLMLTFTMTSCSDDDELIQGTGVSEALWENENEAIIEGETIVLNLWQRLNGQPVVLLNGAL